MVTAVQAIEAHAGRSGLSRFDLQRVGATLERSQPGEWLAIAAAAAPRPVALDAARTLAQVDAAKRRLDAVVVHLTASADVRRQRFESRSRRSDSDTTFDAIAEIALERDAEAPAPVADLKIDTGDVQPAHVLELVRQRLRIVE